MSLRRPGAWQRVVALAPLLLIIVSLPSQVLMRCQMDGVLREACCCPRTQDAAPAETAVASASCCQSETAVHQLPAVRNTATPDPIPALIAVPLPAPAPEALLGSPRGFRSWAPAPQGPPILLLKQAFLI